MSEKVIKCFRLVSGEDVIAEVVSREHFGVESVKLKNACGLVPQQIENGIKVHLIPFPMYIDFIPNKTEIEIQNRFIIIEYTPGPELIKDYTSQFSRIILPKTGGNIQLLKG